MEYGSKYIQLCDLLEETGNTNLIRDFFVQLQSLRHLDKQMIGNQLDSLPHEEPRWLSMVTKTDVRNIIVFLMWKEWTTVIHAKESHYTEESRLGIHIEDLGVYLETKFYVKQIKGLQDNRIEDYPKSYTEWVRDSVDSVGLVATIEVLMP